MENEFLIGMRLAFFILKDTLKCVVVHDERIMTVVMVEKFNVDLFG